MGNKTIDRVKNPRPPSPKIVRALGALFSGEARTQRDAARIAGTTEQNLCNALKRQSIKDYINNVVKERIKTTTLIAASNVMNALLETAESEYVRADIAKHVLNVSGLGPGQRAATTNVDSVSLTINLGNQRLELGKDQPIDITPEPITIEHANTHITKQDQ